MPHDFWEYTLGEVLSVISGNRDKMRLQRRFVEVIYHSCSWSDKRPDITELIPLPGDPTKDERYEDLVKELEEGREYWKQKGYLN